MLSKYFERKTKTKKFDDDLLWSMGEIKDKKVLLYGAGGTGKSTSIKALVNEYAKYGLRIIQINKDQFVKINDIVSLIKNRNYKFIFFMDDLSFEDFEVEYKYFKAIIEGGLEQRPNHVLIYATSNRRHLIKEKFSDRSDDDVNSYDTRQETLSLVSRFGLSIYFPSPDHQEYLNLVKEIAERENISYTKDLENKAINWAMRSTGKSGRTAQQFIDFIKNS